MECPRPGAVPGTASRLPEASVLLGSSGAAGRRLVESFVVRTRVNQGASRRHLMSSPLEVLQVEARGGAVRSPYIRVVAW